jgi:hypothetical protein
MVRLGIVRVTGQDRGDNCRSPSMLMDVMDGIDCCLCSLPSSETVSKTRRQLLLSVFCDGSLVLSILTSPKIF